MNSTRRSLATLFIILCSLTIASAQRESPANPRSSVPIVTATASAEGVNFVSVGRVHQTRLQVFSPSGAQVFDTDFQLGNLVSWQLRDQQGQALTSGSYLYLVTVKDFSERITQKYGTAVLEGERVYLEQVGRNELPQLQANALEAHRLSEALLSVDRIGVSAFNSSSTVDSTSASATGTEPTVTDNISTTPAPGANATGTGSQNYLARWTDNTGTLGNSTLFQNGSRIGLGTTTPGAIFHVVGTQGSVGAGAFQLDTPVTFGSWSGAYPAFEIVNTNLTNNNVSLFSFSDAPSGASHAGMGAVSTSHGHKWGHLFFYSKQSDGYQVRMGIYNGGYVGINTTTPTQRLAVNGNIQVLGGGNGIIFPDGSIQTKATAGTINGTGTANRLAKFTGPNSFGNSSITELASGNVGIGTAAPISKLTVETPTATYGLIHKAGDVQVGTFVGSGNPWGEGGWIGTRSNHPLYFFAADGGTSGAAHMTLHTNGKVEINANIASQLGQDAYLSGLPKAMLRMQGDGTFVACYNGVTKDSFSPCGFSITNDGGGNYTIDFGSGISTQYRFFSLSGSSSIILLTYPGTTKVQVKVGNTTYGYAYYILVF